MTLDSTERCAVTGASDGTVNLWNYSSGVLLANYTLPDETLITGLCVDRVSCYTLAEVNWLRHLRMRHILADETLITGLCVDTAGKLLVLYTS